MFIYSIFKSQPLSLAKPSSLIARLLLLIFSLFQPCLSAIAYLDQPTSIVNYLKSIASYEDSFSGIEGIDAIYLINLDLRESKYARCKALFKEHSLSVNRLSAVNGWELSTDWREFFGDELPSYSWCGGQIGCLLSHLSVIQEGYNRGYQCIWIMEDDIKFVGDVKRLSSILTRLNQLDPEWDVYYTDRRSRECLESYLRIDEERPLSYFNKAIKGVDEEIECSDFRFGNYSYLLSRSGMEKVLTHFTHAYLSTPFDVDIHLIPTIREYGYPKDLVTVASTVISDTERKPTSDWPTIWWGL